jgi:ABC-2 type transport system ATP-binding protein
MLKDDGGRVVIAGLSKAFGAVRAVDDLSFTVEPGSITGFLGPNGAGKTTTLRMLVGLVKPDAGTATIGGRRYDELQDPGSDVGAALESSGFHPARSGLTHLRICCTINGYGRARANEVLAMVGLAEAGRRKVRGYSLGMQQRLALATALLGDPKVLVLDEPTNGLDPEGIVWMRRLLRELADQGHTILVSSHLLSEVEQLVDQVVIINRGRLVRQATLAELSGLQQTTVLVRTPYLEELRNALSGSISNGVRIDEAGPNELRVIGLEAAEVGRRASASQIEVHELITERGDLEQVFFALTAEEGQDSPQ